MINLVEIYSKQGVIFKFLTVSSLTAFAMSISIGSYIDATAYSRKDEQTIELYRYIKLNHGVNPDAVGDVICATKKFDGSRTCSYQFVIEEPSKMKHTLVNERLKCYKVGCQIINANKTTYEILSSM